MLSNFPSVPLLFDFFSWRELYVMVQMVRFLTNKMVSVLFWQAAL